MESSKPVGCGRSVIQELYRLSQERGERHHVHRLMLEAHTLEISRRVREEFSTTLEDPTIVVSYLQKNGRDPTILEIVGTNGQEYVGKRKIIRGEADM